MESEKATNTIARPAGEARSTAANDNKRFVQADYKASTAREPSEPADAPTHSHLKRLVKNVIIAPLLMHGGGGLAPRRGLRERGPQPPAAEPQPVPRKRKRFKFQAQTWTAAVAGERTSALGGIR